MSISEITPYTRDASSTEPPIQKDPNSKGTGYRLIEANVNFLGKPFTDGMPFSDHLKALTRINIHYYSDVELLIKSFNFFEHGFQFCKLEEGSSLSHAIDQYANARLVNRSPMEEESQFSSQVEHFLSSWAKENGIPGIPIVINNVYRNSDRTGGAASPYDFVHADFTEEEVKNPFSAVGKYVYKCGVERVLGEMSNEDYKKITHNALVNVWIPLQDEPSHNTLAVMDTSSVQNLLQKMRRISINDSIGFSLHADPEQVWVVKENLTRKDRLMILFNSTFTPHTAINIEGVTKSSRTSIEFRVDVVTKG